MAEEVNTGGLVGRVKAILVEPASEWQRIAPEQTSIRDVLVSYAVPLAAIGPLAGFIGGQLFGYGAFGFNFRIGLVPALTALLTNYVLSLAGLFVLSAIANFLAPKFGGAADSTQAFKLVAFSSTAGWVAGIFGIVPSLGFLVILGLYSIYLFYVGATPLMKVPQEKATAYTIVAFIAAVVIYVVIGTVGTALRLGQPG